MDPINHFGFSYNNTHQHLPIRKFSQAARVEQHQFQSDDPSSWDTPHHHLDDDNVYPYDITASADSTEHQFVDTFFNNDHYHDVDFDLDLDLDLDTFLMPDDNTDVPMMIQGSEHDHDQDQMRVNGVDDGLQLVHLLLACAEAVGCRDTRLAESILSKIWCSANPLGDSLQRVSYYFATGLKSRLSLLHTNINPNGTVSRGVTLPPEVTREERIEAFELLHQTTPYIEFGFMAANEAIIQATDPSVSLHIIDLGMDHVLQWRSLIRTLGSCSNSAMCQEVSPKLIRITGVLGDRGDIMELETKTEALMVEANTLGIELEFRLIAGPATSEMLTRENLSLKEGEPLFVNSMLHMHTYVKESRGSLKTILQAIKKLGPTLLTVVEQDANHNGPFFLGRFLESLHYYSAIFDSLEASMGRNSIERMKIERNHFAEEIRNIVAYEGTERVERHERADQWRRQLARAGFQLVTGMKDHHATVMKSLKSGEGYTVGNDQKGYVLLGWKGRPIMLAAAWQPSSPLS
ncbi:putative transcription factor GRAS family [Helianthus annuus]|nr:putative transcription factor GRAS family [Helianthus annuus]KAJ0516950.1 putative transcription factor GRAS family [Helianthus annuus]KAJ0684959.1 putative transcription factor GRAS family [Helianthus annuus]KAJ0688886.1 putative transcription factor GRAS family [Helianthus annuus]KAJ0870112.1 putative transcription factor GRAS family [Helianthus annuus]